MKKVFLLAALVLACTAGSNASAMNEAAPNAYKSEMMPVKKTAKKTAKKTSKKTSTKKTSTKKTTSAASNTTAATTTTAATATSNAAASTSATSNAGSAVAGILGAVLGGNSNSSSSVQVPSASRISVPIPGSTASRDAPLLLRISWQRLAVRLLPTR